MPLSRCFSWHGSCVNDLWQRCCLEVLLPRLLIGVVLPRVLFDRFEAILFLMSPCLRVPHLVGIKELAGLFTGVEHAQWRESRRRSAPGVGHKICKVSYPSISTIRVSWLYSLVPGKSGRPKKSSTAIHPKDHMSIDAVYDMPRRTSGER